MHADFTRPSEYTHSDWMQPTPGAGSLDRYKTLNCLRPHLFLEAEVLTWAGHLLMESRGKAWESYRSVMLVLTEHQRGRRPY